VADNLTFTEEDFAPKSQHDFSEDDFKPKPNEGSLLGKSKDELAQIARNLRIEGRLGRLEEGATDVATGLLSIPGAIGSKVFSIPTTLPKSVERPLIDSQELKTSLDPITEAWGMSGEPITEAAKEVTAETGAAMSSPEAIGTLATGPAAPFIFGTEMAKGAPAAIQNLEQVSKTGDEKETAKAFMNAALSIGGPLAIARQASISRETPAAEAAQPKEENAETIRSDTGQPQETGQVGQGSEANRGGDLQQATSGTPNAPAPQGQAVREVSLKEVGPHPTADQLIAMTPDETVAWKNKNRYGMNFESSAGTTSVEIAEKLKPEDIPKLEAERDRLRADFKKEYNEALKAKDPDRLGKTLPTQLKSQTLDEIIADYHEGAANVDYVQYQRLVRELKRAPLEEKYALQQQIEPLKNKYGGKVPPRDLPPAETKAPEGETVLAAQSTPTHGLPAGVPDRGPTFPSELMEASKQLGALVRSRATLRPGVLGQFVRSKLAGIKQSDIIEVGDIRNQKTVAHEIGHSLDGILFPKQNFGESQASLAARVGTGTGKELAKELTGVSELMRGPMTGSRGHIAYRNRATELIADFVSLYAHDADRARAMAPKFAKGFEDALAKDKNTQDVVQGIVSGNVIPKPPDPTLKKQLAGITGTPPQPGTALPGQVPAAPVLPPPARERVAAVAAEGLVKDAVRTFESKVQKARIVGDNWRNLVKSQTDRNDVGAFVEGIGNLEKPGDTIDRVRTRMTPAKERLAKDYRFRQELERQEINKYLKDTEEGEYLKFLEDYLGHFYVDSTAKRQAAVSRWAKESPHAKQRKLPTLKEAVDMGLTPITQDPAVTYELNSRINWQVATNRKFVANLKDIKTGGGQDVVVPAKDAPAGWEVTNNPLIQRVYARQTPSGLMLWRGGAAIHPDIWRSARQILESPQSGTLGKAYDAINGFTRANAFAFSLFHDLTLRSAAIGSQATLANPLRGLVRLFERHPITGERQVFASTRGLGKELLQNEEAVSDAAEHGLKFSYTDSEAYQHNARTFLEKSAARLRDVPVLGKTARLARDIQQWRQEGLWKNTHDAFKIITYNDLVNKSLSTSPTQYDPKFVKEQIASYLNDAYGGQEWQTKFWLDPNTRKIMSRFFLAPDWTLSTLRSVPGLSDVASIAREQAPRIAGREPFPTPKEGIEGAGRRLRFWGTEVAALAMATAAAQYAIYKAFGDDKKGDKPMPWDNELNQKMRVDVTPLMRKLPWHDPKDPTRHYVNLGKRPQEILNWFTEPDKQVLSKASRPVVMIFEQVTGSEGDFKSQWKQDHESFIESLPPRAKAIGTQALPFTFRGNQFALSAPVRKGMTKYKAQQAYESVFELVSNPNRLKSLLRGQQPSEGTIPEMTSQITDAAKRNGVPAEEVMKRALSVVRGHHYNEFFKAFNKNDRKKMDEEARALVQLGATGRGIEESVRRRMELGPVSPE
jgi:hypothetical protein